MAGSRLAAAGAAAHGGGGALRVHEVGAGDGRLAFHLRVALAMEDAAAGPAAAAAGAAMALPAVSCRIVDPAALCRRRCRAHWTSHALQIIDSQVTSSVRHDLLLGPRIPCRGRIVLRCMLGAMWIVKSTNAISTWSLNRGAICLLLAPASGLPLHVVTICHPSANVYLGYRVTRHAHLHAAPVPSQHVCGQPGVQKTGSMLAVFEG